MSALQTYLDHRVNFWNRMQSKPELQTHTLTNEQAQQVFQSIDGDMSPENLHCDGEISASAARAKGKKIMAAYNELVNMGFQPETEMYCVG